MAAYIGPLVAEGFRRPAAREQDQPHRRHMDRVGLLLLQALETPAGDRHLTHVGAVGPIGFESASHANAPSA
jgi:hypothetical protein